MPGFDGTGPMGRGAMTGWGQGYCNPSGRSYAGTGLGRGRGMRGGFRPGMGRGRGPGRGYGRGGAYPVPGGRYGSTSGIGYSTYPMKPEEEVNMLKAEADGMKSELDAIKRRIEELETESSSG